MQSLPSKIGSDEMPDGTVDNLNLQLSADADQAARSLDKLVASLKSINTAFTKDISGMRKFSKEIGTMASAIRTLNGVKVSNSSITSLSRFINSVGKIKTNGADEVANDVGRIVSSFKELSNAKFNDTGINKVVNSLNRLFKADFGKFNPNDFQKITQSIGSISNIPDVSSNVNRLVSSLSRLANAGEKTGQSANDILRLGQQTREAVQELSGIGKISDDVNQFVSSIAKLSSSGNKTGQTASGLGKLAGETLKFFQTMEKAPKISENTIRMTQALAQLASSGGRVNSATNSVVSAFNRLSSIGGKTLTSIKKLASGIVSAFRQIGSSGKQVDSARFSLVNLLKTAVGFQLGYGLLSFVKQSFELGSSITEVENVVDVAFGSMASKAYEFASTATEQFGLSELAAKQYAGTMMAMLNSTGVAQDAAAEMSTTLAGLAGDLASFYNISTDEAFMKLRSAIAGETEPMRQLGVNMTVAALESYALSQGITKSWQSMTQAEQAMLRYNYLMSATAQQQGDYARTINSFANQWRLLTLNVQQFSATIGQGLIAAVLPAIQAINALFVVLQRAATAFRNFMYVLTGYEGGGSGGFVDEFAGIGDVSTGLENLGTAGGDASGGLDDATDSAKDLKKALSVLDFDQLNQLSDSTPASGSGGGAGGGGIGGISGGNGLGDLSSNIFDPGKNKTEGYINEWAERIREAFLDHDWEGLGFEIADGLNRGLQKIYDVINWENVGPKITAFTTAFAQTFNSFVDNFDWELLGKTISVGINTLVNSFNLLFGEGGIDFKNIGTKLSVGLRSAISEIDWIELGKAIGNYFMVAWDTFLGFVSGMSEKSDVTGLTGWQELGIAIGEAINGAFESIRIEDIGTSIGMLVAGIIDALRFAIREAKWNDIAKEIIQGIENAFNEASDGGKNDGILAGLLGIGAIAGLSKILTPVYNVVKKLIEVLGGNEGLVGIGSKLSKIFGSGGAISKGFTVIKGVIGGISLPVTLAASAIAILAAGISDLWKTSQSFRDGISDVWKKISDAISSAKTQIWDKTLLPLWENIQNLFDALSGLFSSLYSAYESSGAKDIFEDIVLFFAQLGGGIISTTIDILSDFFQAFYGLISGGIEVVTGFIEIVDGAISGDWKKIWEGAENIIDGVARAIESIFSGLWGAIKSIFSPVISTFRSWFSGAYKAVQSIWNPIGNWFSTKWSQIKSVFSPVASTFKGWFQNAYTFVQNIWSPVNSWFSTKWSQIKSVFSPVASTFKGWFQNAYSSVQNVWSGVSGWFSGRWSAVKNVFSDVKSFFSSGFQNAYNAITRIFDNLGGYFQSVLRSVTAPIKNIVNGIISGVNWVLRKLGSGTRIASWPGFAKGSKGLDRDTLGIVNDQKGSTYKELIVPPNGKPFIPKGRNVMLPLQKGTKIMPAKQTKEFMKSIGIRHFAGGIGDFFGSAWKAIKSFTGDVWDYLTHPEDLVKIAIDKFTNISNLFEPWLSVAGGIVNKVLGSVTSYVKKIFDTTIPKVNYSPSAGVEQWRSLAAQALRMEGQYSVANLNRMLMQMQTESSGNPRAINNWDSNAKRGTPSKGLMQVIDPTFRAYARPGYNKNIWDPLSNMLAAIRYTVRRYGSLARGWQGHGYKEGIGMIRISDILGGVPFLAGGGLITAPTLALTGENYRKEAVLPLENQRVMSMVADSIVENAEGIGLTREELSQAVAEGVVTAMMNNLGNQPIITVYAELRTENDEVLARAVTRGQQKIDYRNNPVPRLAY